METETLVGTVVETVANEMKAFVDFEQAIQARQMIAAVGSLAGNEAIVTIMVKNAYRHCYLWRSLDSEDLCELEKNLKDFARGFL